MSYTREQLEKALRSVDTRVEIALLLAGETKNYMGRRARNDYYGDVLVVSDRPDKESGRLRVVRKNQGAPDGAEYIDLYAHDLTFTTGDDDED